jgi:hypothetical protein
MLQRTSGARLLVRAVAIACALGLFLWFLLGGDGNPWFWLLVTFLCVGNFVPDVRARLARRRDRRGAAEQDGVEPPASA